MRKFLRQLASDERGTSAVEYGLILAFIVLAMFSALAQVASSSVAMWGNVSNQFERNLPASGN